MKQYVRQVHLIGINKLKCRRSVSCELFQATTFANFKGVHMDTKIGMGILQCLVQEMDPVCA